MAKAAVARYPGERQGYGWMVSFGVLLLLALVYIFPGLALWLPSVLYGR